ncbi:endonuclease/exonuclease/phosphatase family protein [Streptomyces arenae]|uniref:endonuclease/exonuclease/phosphatase family protein n=1 Tax=Streptomyces arenae TaxID=29301 RepID=UPI002659B1C8|nr:endonuclease/exonuclease/phosphatase family protein [Streptomyces arenae]MCG7203056.1 endonuclease/exonuclease/phosphatase family protein [Streptomyces arenae]
MRTVHKPRVPVSRRGTLLAVVVALAALAAALSWSGRPEDTDRTFRVWHWNIAGNALHHGAADDGLAEAAVDSIRNREADFVSLNEVCRTQFDRMKKLLVERGWPEGPGTFARFATTRAASPGLCGGTGDYGIALFSRAPLGATREYALPSDGTAEHRRLLCAAPRDEPRLKFCTVHITTSNAVRSGVPDNVRQLRAVLAVLDGFDAAGQAYIIAGDFNAQPDYARLNPFYAPSASTAANPANTGSHRELDDADKAHCPGYGEWTALGSPGSAPPCGGRAKIDEIFVRESRLAGPYGAVALAVPTSCRGLIRCSDHRVLVGTVRLRLP